VVLHSEPLPEHTDVAERNDVKPPTGMGCVELGGENGRRPPTRTMDQSLPQALDGPPGDVGHQAPLRVDQRESGAMDVGLSED
jgi:hypothetical protein